MDNKISSNVPGEQRCSDLESPLFTSNTWYNMFSSYLAYTTREQLSLLSYGHIHSDLVILLSDLCHNVIETVCNLILGVLGPQVYSTTHNFEESAGNPGETSVPINGIESPRWEWNYQTVLEEDIQAILGDSLHQGLGEALGVVEERSDNSEQLLQLVAQEVTNGVNRKLAVIRLSTSCQQSRIKFLKGETLGSQTIRLMVHHFARILERCLVKKYHLASPDEESPVRGLSQASTSDEEIVVENFSPEVTKGSLPECQISSLDIFLSLVSPTSTEDEFSKGERFTFPVFVEKLLDYIVFSDEGSQISEFYPSSSPDEETLVENFSTEATKGSLSDCQISNQGIFVSSMSSDTTEDEFSRQEKTFLTVFLGKLLDHITQSTKTSVLDLDFDGILKNLKTTLGDTSFSLPQTAGNLHQVIFKKLCQKFGSAKQLQATMVHEGVEFEEAVAREIKWQLHKATQKPLSFVQRLRGLFRRRSSKVKPVPHSEVAHLENGSSPLRQKKQKCPAIIGMFSAVARILKKPFTSICVGSQDE